MFDAVEKLAADRVCPDFPFLSPAANGEDRDAQKFSGLLLGEHVGRSRLVRRVRQLLGLLGELKSLAVLLGR